MPKQLEPVIHDVQIENNFLSQYENSTDFLNFVKAHVEPLNDLENDFQDFITQLPLANAAQRNLDYWGEILQSPTRPSSDSRFRSLLYALIAAYNSRGTASSVQSVALLIVNADIVNVIEFTDARFGFYIANPDQPIDTDFFILAINLAKSLGTELTGVTISGQNLLPIFSFGIDTRENSEGGSFAVLREVSATFYTEYSFPDLGVVSSSERINMNDFVETIDDIELRDIFLDFQVTVADGSDFENELNSVLGSEGGELWVTDRNPVGDGIEWRIVAGSFGVPVERTANGTGEQVRLVLSVDNEDTCEIFANGEQTTAEYMIDGDPIILDGQSFTDYNEVDKIVFTLRNPFGLKKTATFNVFDGGFYSLFFSEENTNQAQAQAQAGV